MEKRVRLKTCQSLDLAVGALEPQGARALVGEPVVHTGAAILAGGGLAGGRHYAPWGRGVALRGGVAN